MPAQPRIDVCSRFLWGRRDPLILPECSDRLGEYFSNYTLEFIDAGHFVPIEAPDRASQEIRALFA